MSAGIRRDEVKITEQKLLQIIPSRFASCKMNSEHTNSTIRNCALDIPESLERRPFSAAI